LSAYSYDIEFCSTKAHADGLSHLPLSDSSTTGNVHVSDPTIFNVQQINSLPVTAKKVMAEKQN